METEMTIEEYNQTIKKLVRLMNVPSFSEERREELEKVLGSFKKLGIKLGIISKE